MQIQVEVRASRSTEPLTNGLDELKRGKSYHPVSAIVDSVPRSEVIAIVAATTGLVSVE